MTNLDENKAQIRKRVLAAIRQGLQHKDRFEFQWDDESVAEKFVNAVWDLLPKGRNSMGNFDIAIHDFPAIFPSISENDALIVEWLNLNSDPKTSLVVDVHYDGEEFHFGGWAAPNIYEEDELVVQRPATLDEARNLIGLNIGLTRTG